jgi:hypothetical protein
VKKLTVHEKLLLAAQDLEDGGRSQFSAEDLVVAAWRAYPDTFGLAGYPDDKGQPAYPNSNRVFVEIMGSHPIRKQGLIVKTGTKTFKLTESGRQRARALKGRAASANGSAKATFSRDAVQELRKILASRAVEKHRGGRDADVTFHDASSLWGISARSTAMEFQGRLGQVEGVLREAEQATAKGPIELEHGGPTYSRKDVQDLVALHKSLLERFADEIAVIRRRTDERA